VHILKWRSSVVESSKFWKILYILTCFVPFRPKHCQLVAACATSSFFCQHWQWQVALAFFWLSICNVGKRTTATSFHHQVIVIHIRYKSVIQIIHLIAKVCFSDKQKTVLIPMGPDWKTDFHLILFRAS
jgi:hypothetical protein